MRDRQTSRIGDLGCGKSSEYKSTASSESAQRRQFDDLVAESGLRGSFFKACGERVQLEYRHRPETWQRRKLWLFGGEFQTRIGRSGRSKRCVRNVVKHRSNRIRRILAFKRQLQIRFAQQDVQNTRSSPFGTTRRKIAKHCTRTVVVFVQRNRIDVRRSHLGVGRHVG